MAKYEYFTLTPADKAYCEKKAATSEFFASLLQSAASHDNTITDPQMNAIENERKRDEATASRPKLKDEAGNLVPVNNQTFLDGKPLCFSRDCRSRATIAVGSIGMCDKHIEVGKKLNETRFAGKRGQEPPAEATTEATSEATA